MQLSKYRKKVVLAVNSLLNSLVVFISGLPSGGKHKGIKSGLPSGGKHKGIKSGLPSGGKH